MKVKKVKFDYTELVRLIKYKYGTLASFCQIIEMPEYSLYNRLKGKTGFTQSDIWRIADVLEIPEPEITRYFFTVKDSK